MLNKKNRLTKNGSFMYVYRKGGYGSTQALKLHSVLAKGEPRIGFNVSNKIGHAVVRNKVKRRLRAIVRENLSNISGCQAVFTANVGIDKLTYDELKTDTVNLLIKAGLYEEKKEQG